MSYAIIRNEKYKRENLKGIYRHNERRNKNYSNKNINKELSHLNYSLKECEHSYEKEFDLIKEKYNLKGQIKSVSNIVCECVITSDKEYFNSIGVAETKRYFETAYKFVCGYKNLGEQYILSAKVHMDEASPHMHLIYIPVVHTQDKKGSNIDKIACSEFWKEKDSYRQLQNAFHSYVTANGFDLERGNPSDRIHLSVEDYKKITGFENSKKSLRDIKIQLPKVPDINDFNKFTLNRDKKIQNEIIKPKDELIKKLHEDNIKLYKELDRQVNIVNKAEKFEKERSILESKNKDLEQKCINLKIDYNSRIKEIEDDFEYKADIIKSENNELYKEIDMLKKDYSIKLNQEIKKVENKYEDKIYDLEKENSFLRKIITTFEKTLNRFIKWVCEKFSISSEEDFIRNFEYENNIYIDPEKQIEYEEESEMEW